MKPLEPIPPRPGSILLHQPATDAYGNVFVYRPMGLWERIKRKLGLKKDARCRYCKNMLSHCQWGFDR